MNRDYGKLLFAYQIKRDRCDVTNALESRNYKQFG